MALRTGDRLGPYEIVASLGAGGMGEVFRARDPRLGRDVALKVLPAETSDPERLRRFEQEARAVAALAHPHILAIHDVGTDHGVTFLALELLEGETLRQRLEREPLPPRRAVEYAVQLCQGLAAAHASGVVHRDLKPENLFLTPRRPAQDPRLRPRPALSRARGDAGGRRRDGHRHSARHGHGHGGLHVPRAGAGSPL